MGGVPFSLANLGIRVKCEKEAAWSDRGRKGAKTRGLGSALSFYDTLAIFFLWV